MLIHLSEVMANVGQSKDAQIPVGLDEFCMNGDTYSFASKEDAKVKIVCVGERKVSISCETNLALHIPCSRCLEDVVVPFEISYFKEFDFSGTKKEEQEKLEEAKYIREYELDVDALISEELMLQFPLQTLCKDNCKGICGICGKNRNVGSCDCDQQGRDPRMLAIQDIFKNFGQAD